MRMELVKEQLEEPFIANYETVRDASVALCAGLTPEDCNLQAMPETSPAKWHLAHTTWFFETFVLAPFAVGYRPVNPQYSVLFNSYYNGIGEQYPRPQRGLLSRPTLDEVYTYRATVDDSVIELMRDVGHPEVASIQARIELGLHHEAQHQELLLTDLKYCLFQNPLFPAYQESRTGEPGSAVQSLRFIQCAGGVIEVGDRGRDFSFDNELPRHRVLVDPFRMASRLITNGEFMAFVADEGYANPEHWLADGWTRVQAEQWCHPLYWVRKDDHWSEYTLKGLKPLDESAPVSHVSYFEAQAYASWAGKRLPTEIEWESVAQTQSVEGNLLDKAKLKPLMAGDDGGRISQLYGDCWEWTNSAYLPYPGYKPMPGAVGEYNGKFMSGQMVLRGGSCLSRAFHIRSSYRNYFYPQDRWQCAGIRLADDD
ncbi:MAG: ergothioneine biosynthesis protein EgtB [Gammaproteobacteria bacterium]|nr:ergothioneine biosynthesis protein EgtB [Gammaproteobacteria bacterium]